MGWRTVVVSKNCKLSYKNDYLVIRSETLQMIHLSEVNLILVENGMVSITSYLINELINNKIKLIFCDEKHNPSGEVMPYYGSFNTSKKILNQIKWTNSKKDEVWKQIVKYKIHNQAMLLKKLEIIGFEKLLEFEEQVTDGDKTNREGHAAKVYFNLLFGKDFIRGTEEINELPFEFNINSEVEITDILKIFNLKIDTSQYITLIEKIEFIINVLATLKIAKILVVPNLKVFLNKEELLEIYKYSIYNNVKLLIIENNSCEELIKYENKNIIDEEFDEF